MFLIFLSGLSGLFVSIAFAETGFFDIMPSPLMQIKNGVEPSSTICKSGLELIFRTHDGFPVCVKPESVSKLIDRNWATTKFVLQKVWVVTVPTFKTNPWDDEKVTITEYYQNYGITVFETASLDATSPEHSHCEGTACQTSKTLFLLIPKYEMKRMIESGFMEVPEPNVIYHDHKYKPDPLDDEKLVTLTTDKAEYKIGEPVTIIVRNVGMSELHLPCVFPDIVIRDESNTIVWQRNCFTAIGTLHFGSGYQDIWDQRKTDGHEQVAVGTYSITTYVLMESDGKRIWLSKYITVKP
jgi:hypothetical protein